MYLTNNTPNETQRQDDFIMHPTNDVCFAGLMENPIVRKGFCAAVMRIRPDEIGETDDYSAAITKDGSLYTWGDNRDGELGNGTRTDSPVPVKIMDNVASVSLGCGHSAAITKDGSLYT